MVIIPFLCFPGFLLAKIRFYALMCIYVFNGAKLLGYECYRLITRILNLIYGRIIPVYFLFGGFLCIEHFYML